MAQFDLKNAILYMQDGYTVPGGAVNGPAGLTGAVGVGGALLAATVVPTSGFTGAVETGDVIKFASHATLYTVTAHVETLGNTTSVTVSPPLTQAVIAADVITDEIGYEPGTTTIVVDGFTGAVIAGDTFMIGADPNTYQVVTHIETLGNTTSITFTPALVLPASNDAAVVVQPHIVEVIMGEGNATFTEKKVRQYMLDRGKLGTVRNGDESPIEIKMEFRWEFLRADTGLPPSIEDILKKRGNAANWVTTDPDPCAPYCIDLILKYAPPCPGVKQEWIIAPQFRYEDLGHDAKTGMVSLTGKANVTEFTAERILVAA